VLDLPRIPPPAITSPGPEGRPLPQGRGLRQQPRRGRPGYKDRKPSSLKIAARAAEYLVASGVKPSEALVNLDVFAAGQGLLLDMDGTLYLGGPALRLDATAFWPPCTTSACGAFS